jgi:hypothetical protein
LSSVCDLAELFTHQERIERYVCGFRGGVEFLPDKGQR